MEEADAIYARAFEATAMRATLGGGEMSGEAPMAAALPTKGLQEAAAAAQSWAASRPRTAEEREAAEAARMRNEYGST